MSVMQQSDPLITPSEYARFIRQIEVSDIQIVSAKLEDLAYLKPPENPVVRVRGKARYENREGQFTVLQEYKVTSKEEKTKRNVMTITVVFAVEYQSAIPLTDDIFEVFSKLNLPVNTWPYLREFVQNMAARMNWAGPALPAYKVGVESRERRKKTTQPVA